MSGSKGKDEEDLKWEQQCILLLRDAEMQSSQKGEHLALSDPIWYNLFLTCSIPYDLININLSSINAFDGNSRKKNALPHGRIGNSHCCLGTVIM